MNSETDMHDMLVCIINVHLYHIIFLNGSAKFGL